MGCCFRVPRGFRWLARIFSSFVIFSAFAPSALSQFRNQTVWTEVAATPPTVWQNIYRRASDGPNMARVGLRATKKLLEFYEPMSAATLGIANVAIKMAMVNSNSTPVWELGIDAVDAFHDWTFSLEGNKELAEAWRPWKYAAKLPSALKREFGSYAKMADGFLRVAALAAGIFFKVYETGAKYSRRFRHAGMGLGVLGGIEALEALALAFKTPGDAIARFFTASLHMMQGYYMARERDRVQPWLFALESFVDYLLSPTKPTEPIGSN